MNKDLILRINKNLIKEDGSFMSFKEQVINLESGKFNKNFPLIISDNNTCLSYIDKSYKKKPIIISVGTINKIKKNHSLGYSFLKEFEGILKNSLFAFDSLTIEKAKIIVLNELDIDNLPVIVAVHDLKSDRFSIELNEVKSIYGREHFERLLSNTYDNNLNFYVNKKIEINSPSMRLQLPQTVEFALSNSYDKAVFNKSQVENDLKAILKPTSIAEQIQKAKYKSQDRQQSSISKNIVKNRNKDKER